MALIGGLVVLVVLGWAIWKVPPLLYSDPALAPKDRADAESSTRTGLIAGLAGLAALGSLLVTSRTYRVTEQGHITDRYTKAIGQLGDDKLDIRLGGIYALERLAVDSKRDHPTVVEVLSAFVRERTAVASKPRRRRAGRKTAHPPSLTANRTKQRTTDVQAALTVLGRLPLRAGVSRGDLSGAHLAGASLIQADLTDADLGGADLTGAQLREADLTGAQLGGADLTGAQLRGATLTNANLGGADLTGAQLRGATLTNANLGGANLTNANLGGANLTDAELFNATLTGANLGGATLTNAKLEWATLTNANLYRANLTGAQLRRATLTDAQLFDATLTGAQLYEADLGPSPLWRTAS